MGGMVAAYMLGAWTLALPPEGPILDRYEFSRVEIAVPIKLVFYAPSEEAASKASQAAFERFRQLNAVMSAYDPESELRRLADTAGEGKTVPVSDDLWRVLRRADEVSRRSDGAFDVTVGPVVRHWRRARRLREMPAEHVLREALDAVGYRHIRFDDERRAVELLKPGMRLDLGGIGKGFAADEALRVLRRHGIESALIDAGGDIVVGDPPPGRPGWKIGVAPLDATEAPSQFLWLARASVATSGSAWQAAVIDGVRYSHIVDPRTGLGLTDSSSVTVVAPDGATADALASAVSVLGPEKGIALVDQTPGAAALVVRSVEDKVETHVSTRWKTLRVETIEK
jgi:FAD:protein FMN transferase